MKMGEGVVGVGERSFGDEGLNSSFYSRKSVSNEYNLKNNSISTYFKATEVNTGRNV